MSQSLMPQNTQPFIYYAPAGSIMEANIVKASQTEIGANQKHASIQMHQRYFSNQLAKKRNCNFSKKNLKKQRKYRKQEIDQGLLLITILFRRQKRQSFKKIIQHSKNVKSHQQQLDLIIKLSVNGFRRVLNSKLCRIFFNMMQKLRSNAELVDRIQQQTAVQLIKQEQSNQQENEQDDQVYQIMQRTQQFQQDQRSYAQIPNKMSLSKILSPVFNKAAVEEYDNPLAYQQVKTIQKVPSFLKSVPTNQQARQQQLQLQQQFIDNSNFFSPNQSELLLITDNNNEQSSDSRQHSNLISRSGFEQALKQRYTNGLAKLKYVLCKKLTKWNLHFWIRLRENYPRFKSNFPQNNNQRYQFKQQQQHQHLDSLYKSNSQFSKTLKSTATLPPQLFDRRHQQLKRYIEQRRQVVFRQQGQQRSQYDYAAQNNNNFLVDMSNNPIADCSTQMNSPELASPSKRNQYSSNQKSNQDNFQLYTKNLQQVRGYDHQFYQNQQYQQHQQQYLRVNQQQRGKNISQAQYYKNKNVRLPRKQFQSQVEDDDYYDKLTQPIAFQRQSTHQDQTQFQAPHYVHQNQPYLRVPITGQDELSSIKYKSRTQSYCTNSTNLPQLFYPNTYTNPGQYDQDTYRQLFADQLQNQQRQGNGIISIRSPMSNQGRMMYNNFGSRNQIYHEDVQQQQKDEDDENIQMIEQHQQRIQKDFNHISQYVTQGRELFDQIKDIVSYNQMIADKYKNILDKKDELEGKENNKSQTSSFKNEQLSPNVHTKSYSQFSDISGMEDSHQNIKHPQSQDEQGDDADQDQEKEEKEKEEKQNDKIQP